MDSSMKYIVAGTGTNIASYTKLLKDANEAMEDLQSKTNNAKAAAKITHHADAKKRAKRKAAKKSKVANRHK